MYSAAKPVRGSRRPPVALTAVGLLVQKFGGSSVADPDRIRAVADHVVRTRRSGNDVVAVWDEFGRYLASARAGHGPFLLECLTHRLRGHYEGDPGSYREALAAADWQAKDPILRLQRHGIAEGWFEDHVPAVVEAEAAEAVEEAVRFGRESPFPPVGLIEELVYADG